MGILPRGGRGGGGGGVPYVYQALGGANASCWANKARCLLPSRFICHTLAHDIASLCIVDSTVSLSSNIMSKAFWMQACNASLSRSALELQQANSSSNGVAVSGAFRSQLCCARVFTASRGPLTRALRSRCSHLLA
jgi:hypothetical protein